MMTNLKSATRKTLLAQRGLAHKSEDTGCLAPMISWLREHLEPDHILGTYRPIKSERDPTIVHQTLHVPLAFPRVLAPNEPLGFFHASKDDDFQPGSFGVLEPKLTLPQVNPDMILVPLVGFDHAGYRLGYGGGFYDRTLAKLRAIKPLFAVGFAYDGQLSDQPLNFEPTDLALDAIMTPTRLYKFTNNQVRITPWS